MNTRKENQKRLLILFLSAFIFQFTFAQDDYLMDIGIGVGLNYGGFGTNISLSPDPHISGDFILGYNLDKVVAGGGLSINFMPKALYNPCIRGFYAYNAPGYIKNYGFNLALGNEFKFGAKKRHGFCIDIVFPFRTKIAKEYNSDSSLSPVTLSLAYQVQI